VSAAAKTNVVPLSRYQHREDELTKPYATMPPLDWTGEDEVTVRWETVRRDTPPEAREPEEPPRSSRGVGPRAAGIALGVLLGVALSIGSFAFLLASEDELPARTAEAATLAERSVEPPRAAVVAVPDLARFEPETSRTSVTTPAATATPVAATLALAAPARTGTVPKSKAPDPAPPQIVPLGTAQAEATAPAKRERVRTQLNLDATQRVPVIVDGRLIGTTPRRIPVEPGEHVAVFIHPTKGRKTLIIEVPKDRIAFATAKF
jgi:hypothetical protein